MRAIEVSTLTPGSVAPSAYYSETGNLLLSKGVVINQGHIDVLLRRNIFTIFASENQEEEAISILLKSSLKNTDDLGFVGDPLSSSATPFDKRVCDFPSSIIELPALRNIENGETGLKALLSNPKIEEIENKINHDLSTDKPVGPPLSAKARQMTVKERTPEYKSATARKYDMALERSANIQLDIINCKFHDAIHIRSIIETFIKIYISDKNMLLNLSSTKHMGDEYFFNHTLNVCLLAIIIASSAGYSEQQVIEIGIGALLHDIGMLLVPKEIRFKRDKLTEDEWYEVKKHPILSLHVLEKIEYLPDSVSYIAYQSHERENGKGYPKQRTSRFMHNYAKIVQVADIYESMSSPRPYRASFLPYKAMEALIKMAHDGAINGDFVKNFLTYASLFPVGSLVEFNDNRIGKVIQSNGTLFAKPIVSILAEQGAPFKDASQIYQEDLNNGGSPQILRPLPADAIEGIGIMDGF
jgi:HD-GYP domain-containing protein (c-di-GMP phosphodiesterase class II)